LFEVQRNLAILVLRRSQVTKVPLAVKANAHSNAATSTTLRSIANEKSLIMKKIQQYSPIYR
jgi:hypothetical protein